MIARIIAFSSLCWLVAFPVKAEIRYETFTLKNGLTGIVVPNHKVPAVVHMVWYRIGAADEAAGHSGIAHFLEHLMFKGTEEVPSGEFIRRVEALGGNQNAFTSWDFTAYYQKIAKEHLGTVMRMEADRMRNLLLDPEEVASEREVVLEERASRIGSNPDGLLGEQMRAAMYLSHPYQRPIIGWEADIRRLDREDAYAMYAQAYHPANAVLVVGGDVSLKTVKKLAKEHYGSIDAGEPMVREWPVEAPAQSERRVGMTHPQVKAPLWRRSWMAPSYQSDAGLADGRQYIYALQMLEEWLSGGESGKLYQAMVVEQKLATYLSVSYSATFRGPSRLSISVIPAEGVSIEAFEKGLESTLETIVDEGPGEVEMQRARTRLLAGLLYSQEGIMPLSFLMGQLAMLDVPLEEVNQWQGKLEAVTAAQVQAAARAVMQSNRSVTGVMLPEHK